MPRTSAPSPGLRDAPADSQPPPTTVETGGVPPRTSTWERFIDHDPRLIRNILIIALVALVLILSQWPRDRNDAKSVRPAPPLPQQATEPSFDWQLLKQFDFSRNDGGWEDTGIVASRDSGLSRMEQARFGSGPEGKWLTVVAERASDSATVYGLDLRGLAYPIPNYFAVDLVYQLPELSQGMWPAPLWLRPLETRQDPNPEGEIDIMEWFGSELGTPGEAAVAIHKTPYDSDHRLLSIKVPQLAGTARNLEHRIRYEKVPGAMTWWIDGTKAALMTRASFDAEAGSGSWDAMFENPRRQWYPRITYQVGPGKELKLAGEIPRGWRRSELVIKQLDVFKLS